MPLKQKIDVCYRYLLFAIVAFNTLEIISLLLNIDLNRTAIGRLCPYNHLSEPDFRQQANYWVACLIRKWSALMLFQDFESFSSPMFLLQSNCISIVQSKADSFRSFNWFADSIRMFV